MFDVIAKVPVVYVTVGVMVQGQDLTLLKFRIIVEEERLFLCEVNSKIQGMP